MCLNSLPSGSEKVNRTLTLAPTPSPDFGASVAYSRLGKAPFQGHGKQMGLQGSETSSSWIGALDSESQVRTAAAIISLTFLKATAVEGFHTSLGESLPPQGEGIGILEQVGLVEDNHLRLLREGE